MHEKRNSEPNLPSGYQRVEQLDTPSLLTPDHLPWLQTDQEFSTVRCTLTSGKSFLLASAVGTHKDLISAAANMNDHQDRNTNNMFYSRVAGFVENNYTPSAQVNTITDTSGIPTYCLRNAGGQRAYFGVVKAPHSDDRLIVKIAMCDKEHQGKVMRVIADSQSAKKSRHKATKGGV